jgi:hypothetical protein
MKVATAVDACLEYHQANSEKNTVITYRFVLGRFRTKFEYGTPVPESSPSHDNLKKRTLTRVGG